MNPSQALEAAAALAVIVMALTDYLVAPLKSTPKVAAWLCNIGLAVPKPDGEGSVGDSITIWVIPYVTFVFGFLLSYFSGLDVVPALLPMEMSPLVSRILTAALVGGGSNLLHRVSVKIR